jgi:GMP synthase (glutamine-hydrolysing)
VATWFFKAFVRSKMLLIIDNASGLGRKTKFLPHLLKRIREMKQQYVTVQTPLGFRRALKRYTFIGCILTGSPTMLTNPLKFDSISPNVSALLLNLPVLAVCFGFQVMAVAYGGSIKRLPKFQNGLKQITFDPKSLLSKGITTSCIMHQYQDALHCMPHGFKPFAWDAETKEIKGIERIEVPFRAGVLFHPEFKGGDADGSFILTRFIDICQKI